MYYLALLPLLIFIVIFFLITLSSSLAKQKEIRENKFKIMNNTLVSEEIRREVLLRCLNSAHAKGNKYLYKKRLAYEEGNQDRYKSRGIDFEKIVNKKIIELLSDYPEVDFIYQWKLGRAICDFAINWKDEKEQKHSILIECKHSDSLNQHWIDKQLKDGVRQLYKYEGIVQKRKNYKVDLLVLIVDFPLGGKLPVSFKNKIIICNVSLIENLISGIKILLDKKYQNNLDQNSVSSVQQQYF